ncbi:hypothetical protein [Marinisporobacter balticus]|uniref:Uncharacterized protein n=1 Tax=Marinisporobacter balticus TaxID=2018667 RepID=A0A4V2SAV7_9FIRM|nr:hypothetical protein [Marinisporobacter balticus]TCO73110.1 hypothetical protein EV214_11611 [Marinisporobacter balticus]
MGDYSRDEWTERKIKWELKIQDAENEIKKFEREINSVKLITNEERIFYLKRALDELDTTLNPSERNKIYKDAIEWIRWTRLNDDNPKIKVNFI